MSGVPDEAEGPSGWAYLHLRATCRPRRHAPVRVLRCWLGIGSTHHQLEVAGTRPMAPILGAPPSTPSRDLGSGAGHGVDGTCSRPRPGRMGSDGEPACRRDAGSSPASNPKTSTAPPRTVARFLPEITAPLGSPVDPAVESWLSTSPGLGGSSGRRPSPTCPRRPRRRSCGRRYRSTGSSRRVTGRRRDPWVRRPRRSARMTCSRPSSRSRPTPTVSRSTPVPRHGPGGPSHGPARRPRRYWTGRSDPRSP